MKNTNEVSPTKDANEKKKSKVHLEEKADGIKKSVAKELVNLKHVEVKRQEISKETISLAEALKHQQIKQEQEKDLSNDEITILESFMGKRLFLSRIAIIANQSRVPLGIEPFKKDQLEKILDSLISNGYVKFELVNDEKVFLLTEKGKSRVQ